MRVGTGHLFSLTVSSPLQLLDDPNRQCYLFAARLAAHYFFILALTAFLCATDIFERLRPGSSVSATSR